MGQTKLEKVLEVFYEFPGRQFTVRKLSSVLRLPKSTVQNQLNILKSRSLVTKDNRASSSTLFRVKKVNFFTEKIVESGLIDELASKLNPSCIILFGSVRKGDSGKDSDIDLFVESHVKKMVELKKYEKRLGHKVQLFVESDMKKLQSHLFNNVVNGIKLFGSFKVR